MPHRRLLSLFTCFRICLLVVGLLFGGRGGLFASTAALPGWEAWPESQQVSLAASGLARIELPHDTLNRLSSDLSDLRLLAEDASEIPWTVLLPHPPRASELSLTGLQVRLNEASTLVRFSVPRSSAALVSLQLQTPAQRFNKPLRLEGSDDGVSWFLILDQVPVHRAGAGQPVSEVRLPPSRFQHYRLVLGDSGSGPIPVTGLRLGIQSLDTAPAAPGPLGLVEREEVVGETRLRLLLAARGAHLSALALQVSDPVLNRPLRLVERCYVEGRVEERVLARGLVSRVPIEGADSATAAEPLVFVVEQRLPLRELLLVIENGDSPPLAISSLTASYRPLQLVFPAPASGRCTLLAGALQARAPSYDLASLKERLSTATAAQGSTPAEFSSFTANPFFRPDDRLPEFPLLGAALSPAAWSGSREVLLSEPGVQLLDLDPALLAASRPGYADLRLVRGGSQVPYIIECCSFRRPAPLALRVLPAPGPGLSRWSLELPAPAVPLDALVLSSQAALFQRHFVLYEERLDSRGEPRRHILGEATWSRRAATDPARFVLRLYQTPLSGSLVLETSDGDNLPISLESAEGLLPVVRLHFKTADTTPLVLLHGNPHVAAPSYDLRLVAAQILSAPHSTARLAPPAGSSSSPEPLLIRFGRHSGVLFWSALILVAGTLLFIIARLLPKTTK